ncbi:MAG: sensor histidine kinase [Paracraurococcus sp.]|jgi:PAS domain S-box-containing protein
MPDDGRPALPDIDCIRGFAGASPMAVAVLHGPSHRIRYVNPAFLATTGAAEAALLGCRVADAFPALDRQRLAALDEVHGSGRPCRAKAIELPLSAHAGGLRLWDAEVSSVRGGGGAVAGVLVLLRDVTTQEAQAARYRALVEAGSLAVWIARPDGRLRESAGWDAVTGQPAGASGGLGWLDAIHPDDRRGVRDAWLGAIATGGCYESEYRLARPEGGWRWTAARAVPRRDPAGRILEWVGANRDIAARRLAEEGLREALAAQDMLVRAADHRIKNSLQLVAGLLRLQSGRMEEAAGREALEAATARVQAVAEAHRALQMSPDLRRVRLADMLRELAAGASVQHPGSDIRIAAPDDLALDAERAIPLALILSELVAEALRHRRPEMATHPVRLEAAVAGGRLAVMVADGGLELPDGTAAGRLGETVIRALAKQIGAELLRGPDGDGGTRVTLRLGLEAG